MAFFFGEKIDLYYRFIVLDFIMDAYWILDIICKLFLFSFQIEATAALCKDGEQIRKKYFNSGYFTIDCVASMPLELFMLVPGVHREAVFFFRAIHLLRVSQLFNYWTSVGTHLSKKFNFFVGRSSSLLLKAGMAYMIANHLFACIYFSIHRYAERNEEFTYVIEDGFATYNEETHQHNICNTRISYCYSRSIYFVANTMTSVSYGDISPYTTLELLWEVVVEILSAYIAATFLGFCSIFLEHRDATGDKSFNAKLANIENYCNYRKLPPQLKSTIVAQYSFLWRKNRSLRGTYNEVLADLSDPCLMEVCVQLCAGVIEAVPILKDASYHVRRRVAAALKPQIVLVNEYVYRAGDAGYSVFFVATGTVQVTLSSQRRMMDSFGLESLMILLQKQKVHGVFHRPGDHFGEFCFISKSGLRPDSAQATSNTELYALSKTDTWGIFLYLMHEDRKQFLHQLMTRIGKVQHTRHVLQADGDAHQQLDNTNSSSDAGIHSSSGSSGFRQRNLYRLALQVFQQILSSDDLRYLVDLLYFNPTTSHGDNAHERLVSSAEDVLQLLRNEYRDQAISETNRINSLKSLHAHRHPSSTNEDLMPVQERATGNNRRLPRFTFRVPSTSRSSALASPGSADLDSPDDAAGSGHGLRSASQSWDEAGWSPDGSRRNSLSFGSADALSRRDSLPATAGSLDGTFIITSNNIKTTGDGDHNDSDEGSGSEPSSPKHHHHTRHALQGSSHHSNDPEGVFSDQVVTRGRSHSSADSVAASPTPLLLLSVTTPSAAAIQSFNTGDSTEVLSAMSSPKQTVTSSATESYLEHKSSTPSNIEVIPQVQEDSLGINEGN